MNEIEGKFKLNNHKDIKIKLKNFAKLENIIDEDNYLFKIKNSLFRFRSSNKNYVFTYKGKNQESEFNKRTEIEFSIHPMIYNFAKNILKRSYRKVREHYQVKNADIFLDYVFDLGYFVEIEAENEIIIQYWKNKLNIKSKSIDKQYYELVENPNLYKQINA